MDKEVWKKIPGYSYYEASTHGRIRSIERMVGYTRWGNKIDMRRISGKILKPYIDETYTRVNVYEDAYKEFSRLRTHTIIAMTFLGPRPKGQDVCHLNGNGFDNRLENLKYGSRKENCAHTRIHGTLLLGENRANSKLKTEDVLNIRKMVKLGFKQKDMAEKYTISRGIVSEIISGKRWKHLA